MNSDTLAHDRSWRLIAGIQELSRAPTKKDVRDIACRVARELVDSDGATFVYNGQEEETPEDDRQNFADSLMTMVPIRTADRTISLGVYWATEYQATKEEIALLQALADAAAAALENIDTIDELEDRVGQLDVALSEAKARLLGQTLADELTGVNNRRGFCMLAEHQLVLIRRQGIDAVLAFIDLDGLKSINRIYGYRAGSRAIAEVAAVLHANFRESDVIGRIGGDDFAVFLTNPQGCELQILRRVEADLVAKNNGSDREFEVAISYGLVDSWAADDLDGLLEAAEEKMRRERHGKHNPL